MQPSDQNYAIIEGVTVHLLRWNLNFPGLVLPCCFFDQGELGFPKKQKANSGLRRQWSNRVGRRHALQVQVLHQVSGGERWQINTKAPLPCEAELSC